jgi:hypothetical protein
VGTARAQQPDVRLGREALSHVVQAWLRFKTASTADVSQLSVEDDLDVHITSAIREATMNS